MAKIFIMQIKAYSCFQFVFKDNNKNKLGSYFYDLGNLYKTREGLRKNIVAVSFFQNCAIHSYS